MELINIFSYLGPCAPVQPRPDLVESHFFLIPRGGEGPGGSPPSSSSSDMMLVKWQGAKPLAPIQDSMTLVDIIAVIASGMGERVRGGERRDIK